MKKPELLAPAGDLDSFYAAIKGGCDAVYIGGLNFGARAYCKNFNNEEMIEAIKYAHLYGVKVFVTVNTMITEMLVKPFIEYIDFLHHNNVDGIIISDIGMIDYLRKTYPNLDIHASTQMNIHNLEGAKFLESLGLKRIVLARETSIEQIEEIKNNTNIEIEVFVHGALCISYSGQCLMSSLIGGRSGNKGTCAQCCRMKYDFYHEDKKMNKEKYLLSTKDLNTLDNIDKLIDIGVDSFKIEGRMKSKEYVYTVTKLYRQAIDNYFNNKKEKILTDDLQKIFSRKYTKGFLFSEDNNNFINTLRPNHLGIDIGKVIKYNKGIVTIKLNEQLNLNDGVRILCDDEDVGFIVTKMKVNGSYKQVAKENDLVEIKIDKPVNVNSKVLKTKDSLLMKALDDQIKNTDRKVSINAEVKCKLNEPILLHISDSVNDIEVTSDYCCEKSNNIKTSAEEISKQINKLGNTVYKIDDLKITMDDNIFVNIKYLNEVRRKAVELLNEKRLYKIPYKKNEYFIEVKDFEKTKTYTYLIHDIDSYNKIKDQAKEIIVDNIDLYNSIKDDRLILKIPRIINKYQDYNIKVLVSEYGSLSKYKNKNTDFSFNVANSYSVAFLHSIGVEKVTLSLELNKKEIEKLINNYVDRYDKKPNLEVIISSYPEDMVSKFNLVKYFNVPNNDNYLVDKFKNRFRIKINNDLMYIYHYKKIEIDDYRELFDLGVNSLRVEEE